MTARPVVPRLMWATTLARVAEQLRDQGVEPTAAWERAAELCRDPSMPLVGEAPTPRPPGVPAPAREGTARAQILAALRTGRRRTCTQLASRTGLTRATVARLIQLCLARDEVEAVGVRPTDGRPERLWRAR